MLQTDHVRAFRKKDELHLRSFDKKLAARAEEIASQYLDIVRHAIGDERQDVMAALDGVDLEAREQKLADGLKKLVLDILQDGNQQDISHEHAQIIQKLYQTVEGEFIKPSKPSPAPQYVTPSPADHTIEDMEEFVEESLSLADKEKELILKALEKYNGKRKLAAQELGISERTLYRKIKEFEIDD